MATKLDVTTKCNYNYGMEYEWDDKKNSLNQLKHGLSFEQAPEVFEDVHITNLDTRQDYGEDRYLTMGKLYTDRVVIVAHTPRDDRTRIISMRKANDREKKAFQEAIERLKDAGFDVG